MKVLYLIHTVEKPYLEYVPQFGHVRFCVCRASALMASSGDMEDDVAPPPPPPPPFPGMLAFLQLFSSSVYSLGRQKQGQSQ